MQRELLKPAEKIWAAGMTSASPSGSLKCSQARDQQPNKYSGRHMGEPLVKTKGGKGPRAGGPHGAGCTRDDRGTSGTTGGDVGMERAEQCSFRAGSHGSKSSFQAVNNHICPCHAEALSTAESGKIRAGKGPQGQLAQWGFSLSIWRPPWGFPVVVRTPGLKMLKADGSRLAVPPPSARACVPLGSCKPPAANRSSRLSPFSSPPSSPEQTKQR